MIEFSDGDAAHTDDTLKDGNIAFAHGAAGVQWTLGTPCWYQREKGCEVIEQR
jgi:hypothetical protein